MKIPKFLKRKRNIWFLSIFGLILLVIIYFVFFAPKKNTSIQTGTVTQQNLQETVLTTGQVISGLDLNLSFQGSGVVRNVLVQSGDRVSQGETLAYLNQASANAALTTAQGSLAQAEANYEKLTAGATPQNIQTAQDAVTSAQQNLDNTYASAVNTLNDAYTTIFNAYSVAYNIQTTYFSQQDQEGISVTNALNDINANKKATATALTTISNSSPQSNTDQVIANMINSLNSVFNDMTTIRTQCDLGIYYTKVSATDKSSLDTQKNNLNTSLATVTTLQNTIASDKIALQTAQDQLNLTKAPATQADIDAAKAQILSAQGQVQSAQATVNNTVVIAPESGTITQVDIKAGEQATPNQEVFILQNVNDLHAEADVSEANIASLQIGQPIDYTFDALDPNQHFAGKVLSINPASTVIAGVVDYLVKGSLDNIANLKPGMTANMTILVASKTNALAVPSTAIINKNNHTYVRVIDNPKTLTYHQVQVQTGLQADGGLVEITSGLSAGQEIVTYAQ